MLLQYTQRLKSKASIDRNLLLAQMAASKMNLQAIFSLKQESQNTVRPQNIVRFLEKALKGMRSQKQQAENVDPIALLQQDFLEKYVNAQITFYIALHYYTEHNMVRHALVILQTCQNRIEEAIEFHQTNNVKGEKNEKMAQELQQEFLQRVEFTQCKLQSKYLMQQYNNAKTAKPQPGQIDSSANKADVPMDAPGSATRIEFDNLFELLYSSSTAPKSQSNVDKTVKIGETTNQKSILNVLEHSDNFRSEAAGENEEGAIDLSKVKINKQFKLVNFLPKLKSVPATPQFFDMAGGYIAYPDAEVEAKKYEIQGGMFSAITGFFG